MAKITFLRVLRSNLKCAVCKNKDCPVRYYPKRKEIKNCDGTRCICEKDQKIHVDKILKKRLP